VYSFSSAGLIGPHAHTGFTRLRK